MAVRTAEKIQMLMIESPANELEKAAGIHFIIGRRNEIHGIAVAEQEENGWVDSGLLVRQLGYRSAAVVKVLAQVDGGNLIFELLEENKLCIKE